MTCLEITGLSTGALGLVSLALGVPCSPFHWSGWLPDLMAFVCASLRARLR